MKLDTFRVVHEKERKQIIGKLFLVSDQEKAEILLRLGEIGCPDDLEKLTGVLEFCPQLSNEIKVCVHAIQSKFGVELNDSSQPSGEDVTDSGAKNHSSSFETGTLVGCLSPDRSCTLHEILGIFAELLEQDVSSIEAECQALESCESMVDLPITHAIKELLLLHRESAATSPTAGSIAGDNQVSDKVQPDGSPPIANKNREQILLPFQATSLPRKRAIYQLLSKSIPPVFFSHLPQWRKRNPLFQSALLETGFYLHFKAYPSLLVCCHLCAGASGVQPQGLQFVSHEVREMWARWILAKGEEQYYFALPGLLAHFPEHFLEKIEVLTSSSAKESRLSGITLLAGYPFTSASEIWKTLATDFDEGVAIQALTTIESGRMVNEASFFFDLLQGEKRDKARSKLIKLSCMFAFGEEDFLQISSLKNHKDARFLANLLEGLWHHPPEDNPVIDELLTVAAKSKNNRVITNAVILAHAHRRSAKFDLLVKKLTMSREKWFQGSLAYALGNPLFPDGFDKLVKKLLLSDELDISRMMAQGIAGHPRMESCKTYLSCLGKIKPNQELLVVQGIFALLREAGQPEHLVDESFFTKLADSRNGQIRSLLIKNLPLWIQIRGLEGPECSESLHGDGDARVHLALFDSLLVGAGSFPQGLLTFWQSHQDIRILALYFTHLLAVQDGSQLALSLQSVQNDENTIPALALALNSFQKDQIFLTAAAISHLQDEDRENDSSFTENASSDGASQSIKKPIVGVATAGVAEKTPVPNMDLVKSAALAFKSGNYLQAASSYRDLCRIEPKNPKWFYALVQCLVKLKKYDLLRRVLPGAIALAASSGEQKMVSNLNKLAQKLGGC